MATTTVRPVVRTVTRAHVTPQTNLAIHQLHETEQWDDLAATLYAHQGGPVTLVDGDKYHVEFEIATPYAARAEWNGTLGIVSLAGTPAKVSFLIQQTQAGANIIPDWEHVSTASTTDSGRRILTYQFFLDITPGRHVLGIKYSNNSGENYQLEGFVNKLRLCRIPPS